MGVAGGRGESGGGGWGGAIWEGEAGVGSEWRVICGVWRVDVLALVLGHVAAPSSHPHQYLLPTPPFCGA